MTGEAAVRAALERVHDPEIPVVSITDLGIVRDVSVADRAVTVTITPTYSGCPAMQEITADIRTALAADGWSDVTVQTVLSPAWTTDWLSARGRQRLREFGIAPPSGPSPAPVLVGLSPTRRVVPCPRCGSPETEELAHFASTACKALWRCLSCREPFDHFKPH